MLNVGEEIWIHICVSFLKIKMVMVVVLKSILKLEKKMYSSIHRSFRLVINSLAPGRFKVNIRWVNFKLILVVNGWGISCETAFICISLDHIYGKSTLVQVMAWCRQATSHYLSQCWLRYQSPYGVTRPQWVKPVVTQFVDRHHLCTL